MVKTIETDQVMLDLTAEGVRHRTFPSATTEVMPGVRWGAFDQLYTPAFWAGRAWQFEAEQMLHNYRLGPTLAHEVVACILGGYGIPAEVGLAAYRRLQQHGIPERVPSAHDVWMLLREPLPVLGRLVRYRFAAKKAEHVAAALAIIKDVDAEKCNDRELRDFLISVPGVGPKTASWITRNWRDSDAVAILDVHICRACVLAHVFETDANPSRDYFSLESRFLKFATAIGVKPSILDNLIWQTMRGLSQSTRQVTRMNSTMLTDDRRANGVQHRRARKARDNVMAQ